MAESNKTLPNNIQAEQAVLGCLMFDYVGCDGADRLRKDDFYSPAHQIIFEAMQTVLKDNKKTVDFVTVIEALTVAKKLDAIGGVDYLNKINDSVPSVALFEQYCAILKKNSVLRLVNRAGKDIVDLSMASDDEQATLSHAEKLLFDIGTSAEKKDLTAIKDELSDVLDHLDEIRKDPSRIWGVRTGYNRLDDLTNGFHGGELIVLGARPGEGKTALGLNMIANAATKYKRKCAVFSLEMSKYQLSLRAACSSASISSYRAGRGDLGPDEWSRLEKAVGGLSAANIYIDDNSLITPFEIKRKCMRLQREQGLDFVMIDYLGLMGAPTGGNQFANRQEIVSANSRAIKIMAKELNIPVLLIAQLNRNVETQKRNGEDVKPELHDLRESGAIEQDADIVMFIHKKKEEAEAGEAQDAELLIRKHRNGATGTIKLTWYPEFTRFENQATAQAIEEVQK